MKFLRGRSEVLESQLENLKDSCYQLGMWMVPLHVAWLISWEKNHIRPGSCSSNLEVRTRSRFSRPSLFRWTSIVSETLRIISLRPLWKTVRRKTALLFNFTSRPPSVTKLTWLYSSAGRDFRAWKRTDFSVQKRSLFYASKRLF